MKPLNERKCGFASYGQCTVSVMWRALQQLTCICKKWTSGQWGMRSLKERICKTRLGHSNVFPLFVVLLICNFRYYFRAFSMFYWMATCRWKFWYISSFFPSNSHLYCLFRLVSIPLLLFMYLRMLSSRTLSCCDYYVFINNSLPFWLFVDSSVK